TFDFVIVSTVLGETKDVQRVFECARAACHARTRVIIAYHNAVWEPLLRLATLVGLRRPVGKQNWLSVQDLSNLAYLADLDIIRKSGEVLLPLNVPLLSTFFNRFLVKFWPWPSLGLIQLLIAKPHALPGLERPRVTVVVPTRNERGNIQGAVERTPEMGSGTELIFVDGNSTDGTVEEIQRYIDSRPDRDMKLILQGEGTGKGDAVRKGFAAAEGDILMILDADLTVPPETLPRFVDALVRGKGEFINGTRLVYPMEDEAMRFLNKCGNRFFSALFTWLLNQPIRDTLCGTKVLTKESYELICRNRSYFGDFDPFGDFDLILGAAKANLKIAEVPVRYEARRYGTTNISRFRHGWLLLQMSWVAFRKLKLR
ncbi:MAG: glycosyltransferase family 2 protein, partial [Phycisphaerae bacterium]